MRVNLLTMATLAITLTLAACRDDTGYPDHWAKLSTKSWVGGMGTGCPNLSGNYLLSDARAFQWLFGRRHPRFRFAHTMKILPSLHASSVQFEFSPSTIGLQQMQDAVRDEAALPKMTFIELARLEKDDFQCQHGFLVLKAREDSVIALSKASDGALIIRLDLPSAQSFSLKLTDGIPLDADRQRHWQRLAASSERLDAQSDPKLLRINDGAWNLSTDTLCVHSEKPVQPYTKLCAPPAATVPFASVLPIQASSMYLWPQSRPEQAKLQTF
jgi:hypothetical protein